MLCGLMTVVASLHGAYGRSILFLSFLRSFLYSLFLLSDHSSIFEPTCADACFALHYRTYGRFRRSALQQTIFSNPPTSQRKAEHPVIPSVPALPTSYVYLVNVCSVAVSKYSVRLDFTHKPTSSGSRVLLAKSRRPIKPPSPLSKFS